MAAPTVFASSATNPGGTGSTITVTLPTHAANDLLLIYVGVTGNTTWTVPSGWTLLDQRTVGTASTGIVGTWMWKKAASSSETNPVCTLGATVTRAAVALTIRGEDLESPFVTPNWGARGFATGTANPVRPPTITTLAPEMLVIHGYGSRTSTNAPEPTGYSQDQEVIISGTLVINVAEQTVAAQNTSLANQDASPTSGVRWTAGIVCIPSVDYPYYRAGAQATTASGTSVTPTKPAGTTNSDVRGNADIMIATVEGSGSTTLAAADTSLWTALGGVWSGTTSGGGSTVKKFWAKATATPNMQFTRTGTGEISACITTYYNCHQTVPIGTFDADARASSTTSTFDAITRSKTKVLVQACCVADATPTFTSPSGWTERMDGLGITCADQIYNAIGSSASASFTLSAGSPTLVGLIEIIGLVSAAPITVTPSTATLVLATFAPSSKLAIKVIPSTQSVSLSTFAPSSRLAIKVIPSTKALSLLTFVPQLALKVSPSTRGLTIAAFSARLALAVVPNTRSLSLTSFAPTVTATTNATVQPSTSSLILSSFAPSLVVFVTFPNTPILDNFNRANEGPPPSANWTNGGISPSLAGLRTRSNRLQLAAGQSSGNAYWSASQFGPDSECYLTSLSGVSSITIGVRLTDIGLGTSDGYVLRLDTQSRIQKLQDGAFTTLATNTDQPGGGLFGNGAKFGLRIRGSSIEGVQDFGTGWQLLVSVTDTTFSNAGFIGVVIEGTSAGVDDFGGGNIGTVIPDTLALITVSFAPDIKTGIACLPSTINLTLTTFAPTVVRTENLSLVPSAQGLSLTQFAPSLKFSIIPTTKTLSLSTFAPTIVTPVTVSPTTRNLPLTSLAPILAFKITPSASSLSIVTFVPSSLIAVRVQPNTINLSSSTFAPVIKFAFIPSTQSLSLTTFAPIALVESHSVTVTPSTVSLVLSEFAPVLSLSVRPSSQSLITTTFAPTIITPVTVSPATKSLATNTFAPTLAFRIIPATNTLSLSTFAPTVLTPVTVSPSTSTLSLSEFAPRINYGIVPSTKPLSLTSFAPVLALHIIPQTQTLTLTTFPPIMGGNTILLPITKSLSLTTYAPILAFKVRPTTQTLTIATFNPAIHQQFRSSPATASLNLSTYRPVLASRITPNTRALSTTTFSPSIKYGFIPATHALTLTRFAPVLARAVIPSARTLTLTRFAPRIGYGIVPATQPLAIQGFAPSLRFTITPQTQNLTLTGYAPLPQGLTYIFSPSTVGLVITTYSPGVFAFGPRAGINIARENRTIGIDREARRTGIDAESSRLAISGGSRALKIDRENRVR